MWLDKDRQYQMAVVALTASLRLTWKHKERVINEVFSRILPEKCLSTGQLLPKQR